MSTRSVQDILPLVEKPSQYLGNEINTTGKHTADVRLKFALAFPDLYEIGTSHFGLQILYGLLNAQPGILAERVYAPGSDMAAELRKSGIPLGSMESRRPLGEFDILGFSLLYELNYTNVLSILGLAEIPFYASQRDVDLPLIVAGGPCTCNPEPVADFFDAMVIGDGEEVILKLCEEWLNWKTGASGDKQRLLNRWRKIKGVYIPSFFKPGPGNLQPQRLQGSLDDYRSVTRAVVGNLDSTYFPDAPVVPYGKPVHDRLRMEVSRGCTRGCRFCQAGMIYRPVRERSAATILSLCDTSIEATGYEDLSLLSLSTSDYGCIGGLLGQLMGRYAAGRVAVSLPSLRAGTLTPELLAQVKKVRKTGFTIAPEAGSQRLRDVINKNIGDNEIFKSVEEVFRQGWQVIKLYFMIGLPTETDEDIDAIVDLVQRLRMCKGRGGRRPGINVSVTTFIPKPHTPFQWSAQLPLDESRQKIFRLKRLLNKPGIRFKWQNPEVSLLEGLWSRGDRRLAPLLVYANQSGCQFDGWSDKFRFDLWKNALDHQGVDIDYYTTRRRELSEALPWDHIDVGVDKKYLVAEWKKAINGDTTADCRHGECNDCGVCDFETIAPWVFNDCKAAETLPVDRRSTGPITRNFKTVEISYSKLDQARYFGHLELVNVFLRAIRRAEIPMKFSQGFHPKPKVSFVDPLPVGIESYGEKMYLTVADEIKPERIIDQLNAQLPEGLNVTACRYCTKPSKGSKATMIEYRVRLKQGRFDPDSLLKFREQSRFEFTRKNRKGRKSVIDLKQQVKDIEITNDSELKIVLSAEKGSTIRPAEVMRRVFGLSDHCLKLARVVKLKNNPLAPGVKCPGHNVL